MSIKIDQAFVSAILSAGLAIDIVHENGIYSDWNGASYDYVQSVYTPDAQVPYAEIKVFPAGKQPFSLKHSDEAVGLFQAIIRYPVDEGAFLIKEKAELIISALPIGGILSYEGQNVNIVSNSRDSGSTVSGFYEIIVRANYRAFVTR